MINKNCTFHTTLQTAVMTPEARSLEERIRKMLQAGEPVEAISPIIYTDRKDGVRPEFDPRTDRQEVALEANNHVTAARIAAREAAQATPQEPKKE